MKSIVFLLYSALLLASGAVAQSASQLDTEQYLKARMDQAVELDNLRFETEKAKAKAEKEEYETKERLERVKQGESLVGSESSIASNSRSSGVDGLYSPVPEVKRVVGGTVVFSYLGHEVRVQRGEYIGGYKVVSVNSSRVIIAEEGAEPITLPLI